MTTYTCRENTVKHIDSASNPLDDILRSANSHEIVWLILWEGRFENIEDTIHIWFPFSDRESTDSDTWSIERCYICGRFSSQIFINNPLNDSEKVLRIESCLLAFFFIFEPLFFASQGPAMSPFHRLFCILMGRTSWRTLIERHDDIGTQVTLHIKDGFRREKMF